MIARDSYLRQLIDFKDKAVTKVITGIRRSGKSTLLKAFVDYLKQSGVKEDNIIFLNLESFKYEAIRDYSSLYHLIQDKITTQEKYYILLDEVQNVDKFEKAVESLSIDFDVDIYLTGSNAYMLSTELATLLSGRYVEIRMWPLSFKEYYSVWQLEDKEKIFYQYMRYGGFPFIAKENDENIITNYLDGIYNTVVLKDIIKRNNIKDVSLLESILKMVLSAIGSEISPSSIARTLKGQGKQISSETIEKYLDMFSSAFILQKAVRYDIKGKAYLKTLSKYYVSDMGLRNNVLGYRQMEVTHALENMVYFELIRRGYKVDVGKIKDNEIDFLARKKDKIEYYQVCFTVNNSKETLDREIRPFNNLDDHYQRFLITMDKDFVSDISGIQKLYAVDWFLQE